MRAKLNFVKIILINLVILMAFAFTIELWIRYKGNYYTYLEKIGFPQTIVKEQLASPWVFSLVPNSHEHQSRPEFQQEIVANEDGISGSWVRSTDGDTAKLLFIGDSFTLGIGDPGQGGYVGRLARALHEKRYRGKSIQVINAGVPGSDPIFGLELLKRKLLKYRPNIVFMTFNATDIPEYERRGGFERFDSLGMLRPKLKGKWESFFYFSHLVRFFILDVLHYDFELVSPEHQASSAEAALRDYVKCAVIARDLGQKNGFTFVALFHPTFSELSGKHVVFPLSEIELGVRKEGIFALNVYPYFSRGAEDGYRRYFWPIDQHYNPSGYQLMAEAIFAGLRDYGLLF